MKCNANQMTPNFDCLNVVVSPIESFLLIKEKENKIQTNCKQCKLARACDHLRIQKI